MIVDRNLIRTINSGGGFALIGAGPSIAIGLPSWTQLAWGSIELLDRDKAKSLHSQLEHLIKNGEHPKVFSIVSEEAGEEALATWLEKELKKFSKNGEVYRLISEWPFASYLTTNYDKALVTYLKKAGIAAVEKFNNSEDMRTLHTGSRNVVFKIHGDPEIPPDLILAQEQYKEFQNAPEREYWRQKIQAAFQTLRIVIIGYSMSDPYFLDYLEKVKQYSDKENPIFVFATDFDEQEISNLYKSHNIRIIPYSNQDGSHKDLMRTLRRFSVFIAPRNSQNIRTEEVDTQEAEIASALYLFAQLRLVGIGNKALANSYAVTILKILSHDETKKLDLSEIVKRLKDALKVTFHPDPESVSEALELLQGKGFIVVTGKQTYSISPTGQHEILNSVEERRLIEEQFNVACSLFLADSFPNLSEADNDSIIDEVQAGLTRAFRKRGLEIAGQVYLNQAVDPSDALDLLDSLNEGGKAFNRRDMATAYIDLMIEIITRPNQEIKKFLALVSQGYFAFHALGWDEKTTAERLNIAKETSWILDASVIIPALAKGSINHNYAIDLIKSAQELGLSLSTTKLLFDEVVEHANWAFSFFKDADPHSADLLLAATGGPGYRPNLFLSGFITWSSKEGNTNLLDYFRDCFGEEFEGGFRENLGEILADLKVEIINFEAVEGFTQEFLSIRDTELMPSIVEKRKELGTYRSEEQCKAEAEVLLLAKKLKYNFLSQSTVLNKLSGSKVTLDPEALYKFLALFSSSAPDPDLVYSSMANYFYTAGIVIVDVDSIKRFVEPSLHQARMKLEEKKGEYEELLGRSLYSESVKAIDNSPIELRPFYSIRTVMLIAEREGELRVEAERKAAQKPRASQIPEDDRLELERFRGKKKERERERLKKKRARQSRPSKRKKK